MGDSGSEKDVRNILNDAKFSYEGETYRIIQNEKPSPETKTDFYIEAQNVKTRKNKVFKISYKKPSYSFVENKLKRNRAEEIFGDDWSIVMQRQIMQDNTVKENIEWKKVKPQESLAESFRNFPLVDFKKKKIMLGWRYEIEVLNRAGNRLHSGRISEDIAADIFYGKNYTKQFRDAKINGKSVPNSGIPDYILVLDPEKIKTAQDVFDNLESIKGYAKKYKKMRVSFISHYYRYSTKKSSWVTEGNSRQLAVWIKWSVVENKLQGHVVLDTPLEKIAGEVISNLKECLDKINIARSSFEITMLRGRLTADTISKG